MGEVPAHAPARRVHVRGGRQRGAAAVPELQVAVHVVADGLDPAVAGGQRAEPGPRLVSQHVGQAVPAGQGVDQRVVGQRVGRGFGGAGIRVLGSVGNPGHHVIPDAGPARGQHGPGTRVAVQVGIAAQFHGRLHRPALITSVNIRGAARLHLEDDRRVDRRQVGEITSHLNTPPSHTPIVHGGCFCPVTPGPAAPGRRFLL
jgi:hypothetical protein